MSSEDSAIKHTRFDSDSDVEVIEEDGECAPSPNLQKKTSRTPSPVIVNSDVHKGNEVDYGGFFMDRTESNLDMELEEVKEADVSMESTDDNEDKPTASKWMLGMFSDLLKSTEDLSKVGTEEPPSKRKRFKPTCFNCDSTDHGIAQCPDPKDFKRIREAKNALRDSKNARETSRYHDPSEGNSDEKFRPGKIGSALREALGIGPDDIPEWIYRMRKLGFLEGYPPAYLRRALKKDTSAKPLKFHMIEGSKLIHEEDEDVEMEEEESEAPVVMRDKMIYYLGFNQTYRSLRDREPNFRVPPFDQFVAFHQEKQIDQHREEMAEKKRESQREKKVAKRRRPKSDTEDEVMILEPPRPPVLDGQGDDDDVIVIDRTSNAEPTLVAEPQSPSSSSASAPDGTFSVPLTPKTPSAPPPTPGSSKSVLVGTPVMIRKDRSHEYAPELNAFSKGIVPFTPGEESTQNRGFLRKIVAKIKEVTGKK